MFHNFKEKIIIMIDVNFKRLHSKDVYEESGKIEVDELKAM